MVANQEVLPAHTCPARVYLPRLFPVGSFTSGSVSAILPPALSSYLRICVSMFSPDLQSDLRICVGKRPPDLRWQVLSESVSASSLRICVGKLPPGLTVEYISDTLTLEGLIGYWESARHMGLLLTNRKGCGCDAPGFDMTTLYQGKKHGIPGIIQCHFGILIYKACSRAKAWHSNRHHAGLEMLELSTKIGCIARQPYKSNMITFIPPHRRVLLAASH